MALPSAMLEGGGDKMLPLIWNNAGANAAAAWKGVYKHTLNTENVAHLGVATHEDASTWGALGPVVVVAGVEGTTVRKLSVDATGRLAGRPMGVYNNAGANAFGHPFLVGQETLNTEAVGWLATASHDDASTFDPADPIQVIGGTIGTGAVVKRLRVDAFGMVQTSQEYGLGGQRHKDVAVAGTAVNLAANACRRVILSADVDNVGALYVGISTVTNNVTEATGGLQLAPGGQLTLDILNTNLVWLNGAAGNGAGYLWLT